MLLSTKAKAGFVVGTLGGLGLLATTYFARLPETSVPEPVHLRVSPRGERENCCELYYFDSGQPLTRVQLFSGDALYLDLDRSTTEKAREADQNWQWLMTQYGLEMNLTSTDWVPEHRQHFDFQLNRHATSEWDTNGTNIADKARSVTRIRIHVGERVHEFDLSGIRSKPEYKTGAVHVDGRIVE